jgi:RNA polymerase sigma-70 factor, ECF subfamily
MAITIDTLRAAREGDTKAESVLMGELYRPIYFYLRKRTGRTEAADELCQTVFLKVFEKIDTYQSDKARLETWVFTIARHTLIDYYRQYKELEEMPDIAAIDTASNTAGEAERRDVEIQVARLLKSLPEDMAEVVTLRALDEMSYESIAELIGKTPEAIRQIYSRALSRLRELAQATSS